MPRFLICLLLVACSPSKKPAEEEGENKIAVTAIPSTAVTTKNAPPEPAKPAVDPSGQSFQEGMQRLCDSIQQVDSDLDPSSRQVAIAKWIDENVKNTQVRELFSIMGEVPPSKRAGMMQAAAAKAGLESCPIADQ